MRARLAPLGELVLSNTQLNDAVLATPTTSPSFQHHSTTNAIITDCTSSSRDVAIGRRCSFVLTKQRALPTKLRPSFPYPRHSKISIIGTRNVGMAIAQTILTQDLTDQLVLVNALPDKLRGEMLDLQHAAAILPRIMILASTD
ncbi:hypothetical protein Tsubulata_017057 [Turnera subulata]|uniref:Lactate/malate dehydrogenase N-terminal domain-containing protein n=1 Tax=Turnera subulata TaxID=218843 RepID=A0A9Q0IW34_9ROSI|nr:hypothetical protein Tsubulata_017057 [Turnera subulata]